MMNLYGMDLSSMTSTALTSYGIELKKRIEELNKNKTAGNITKDEKKELEADSKILSTVAAQNKAIMKIDGKLKAVGIDLGSIKDKSEYSLTKKGIDAIDKEISITPDADRKKKLQDLKDQLSKGSIGTGRVVFNAFEDSFKLAGTGFAAGAAGMVIKNAVEAIGNIKIEAATSAKYFAPDGSEITESVFNTLKEGGQNVTMTEATSDKFVKDWIASNMPWLGTVVGLAAAAGACFFIAKQMKNMKNAKDLAYVGTQAHQLDAEEKAIAAQKEANKEQRNVTIETEAARAEVDPAYLDSLKTALGGKTVEQILQAGVDDPNISATQINAAKILNKVDENRQKSKKATDTSMLKFDTETLKNEIGDINTQIEEHNSTLSSLSSRLEVFKRNNYLFINTPEWGSSTDELSKNADQPLTKSIYKAVFGKNDSDYESEKGSVTNAQLAAPFNRMKADRVRIKDELEQKIQDEKDAIRVLEGSKNTKASDLAAKQRKLAELEAQKEALGE